MADLSGNGRPTRHRTTGGHILTALAYEMDLDVAHRRRLPSGVMVRFMGTAPPPGWLLAQGQAVDATRFPELAQVLQGQRLPNEPGWMVKL